jgi:ribosomal protein S18 acetylase RimI-like enzyme
MSNNEMSNRTSQVVHKVHIRPSKLADKDTLLVIVNEVYKQCGGHLWVANRRRLSEELFMDLHNRNVLFIAELPCSEIVGCVVISNHGNEGREMSMLVVRPDCRGQGIGRKLVDYVINTARKEGCRYVRLGVIFSKNQGPDPWKMKLRMWYESIGFQYARDEDFTQLDPSESANLAQEVTFSIFEKLLNE